LALSAVEALVNFRVAEVLPTDEGGVVGGSLVRAARLFFNELQDVSLLEAYR
jgi:hypothetical protein